MADIIVNFCPTGMVPRKAMNPHVPLSVSEIVEQVHAAAELGITIAHLHAREPDESPSTRPEIYADIMSGVRRHCPELVICLSTSGRGGIDLARRSAVIELCPDMCSLTLGSLNFVREASINAPDTIRALVDRMAIHGVHPELECFDLGMMNYGRFLIGKGVVQGPHYWNLLFGNIDGFQASPDQIGCALRTIPDGHHFAMGGLGDFQLPVTGVAIALGLGVRVGLEDNLWWDTGRTQLATNQRLLERVHELMQLHGHRLLPSKKFGDLGFYNAQRFSRI